MDFPEAIKRIDVKAPAPDMEESGAVLVDTPGLYSRMKFGYDRMTRDFRNAAACAVFVVKTDNVFLEQVFNEFSELLDLFSRIFLVLNIDSTKVDVCCREISAMIAQRRTPLCNKATEQRNNDATGTTREQDFIRARVYDSARQGGRVQDQGGRLYRRRQE